MLIYKEMGVDIEKREILSFVGGGGKTTTIFALGKELVNLGKKVLISTTTAIFTPSKEDYDYFFLGDIPKRFNPSNGTITILGKEIKNEKLIGVSLEKIDEIVTKSIFDIILIEADGSKRKPIKAPGNHEPVVPQTTTKTIGVIGLDSLGKTIDEETVHRPELFIDIVGKEPSNIIHEENIRRLVLNKSGLFKDSQGDKILLLNKANSKEKLCKAFKIKELLKEENLKKILIADIKEKLFY